MKFNFLLTRTSVLMTLKSKQVFTAREPLIQQKNLLLRFEIT